jgi:hypothetical protein
VSIGFVIDRRLGLGKRRFIDPGGANNRKPGRSPLGHRDEP